MTKTETMAGKLILARKPVAAGRAAPVTDRGLAKLMAEADVAPIGVKDTRPLAERDLLQVKQLEVRKFLAAQGGDLICAPEDPKAPAGLRLNAERAPAPKQATSVEQLATGSKRFQSTLFGRFKKA